MKELMISMFIYAGALVFGLVMIAVFLGKLAVAAKREMIEIERGKHE